MLEAFTRTTFSERLGDRFHVQVDPATTVSIQLMDIVRALDAATASARARGDRDPFSVLFWGPRDSPLPEATYRVAHPVLGTFDLFLQPSGSDGDGVRYAAVFG